MNTTKQTCPPGLEANSINTCCQNNETNTNWFQHRRSLFFNFEREIIVYCTSGRLLYFTFSQASNIRIFSIGLNSKIIYFLSARCFYFFIYFKKRKLRLQKADGVEECVINVPMLLFPIIICFDIKERYVP